MKIIIPAYNPNRKILTLIEEIKSVTDDQIIIIDDGSGKEYQNIFKEIEKMDVIILRHGQNLGKGAALKTGFKYLIENNEEEGCVCADCDGQHKVNDIINVLNQVKKQQCIILGCRTFNGKIPLRSKIGNVISRFMFRGMTGHSLKDTQTGLRGYPAVALKWMVEVEGNRYEYEFNLLMEICEKGKEYKQVDIETIYEDNNKTSHFNPIKDSILIYKPVFLFVISSLLSAIVDLVLLLIFNKIFNNLLISVIFARILSSILNFLCNKVIVFKSVEEKNKLFTIIKYYGLACCILIINYVLLNFLYARLSINLVISKIITEIVLYMFSFVIQKRVVFNKNKQEESN